MKHGTIRRTARPLMTAGWAVALSACVAGCGQDPRSPLPLFPAHGVVTLDGKPLGGATVQFIPSSDTKGQGGTGQTAADGSYTLMTPLNETGVLAGEYQVVIQARPMSEGDGTKDPPTSKPSPAVNAPNEPLPPYYSDPVQTKLKATVTPDGNPPINFDLKSVQQKK